MMHDLCRSCWLVFTITWNLVGAVPGTATADEQAEQQQEARLAASRAVLREAGLREVSGRWIAREEARLIRLWQQLRTLERAFILSEKKWEERYQAARQTRLQIQQLQTNYEENRRQLDGNALDPLVRQRLEEKQRAISGRVAKLREELRRRETGADADASLSAAAREHALAWSQLGGVLLALRDAVPRIGRIYVGILAQDEIADALLEVQGDSSSALGPLRDYRRLASLRLPRVERLLFGEFMPIYQDGPPGTAAGQYRVACILNGRQIVSFRLTPDAEATLLPASMAKSLRLEPAGPAQGLQLGDRTLQVTPARLDSLQVGKYRWSSLPVLVLAAEDEDVGPRLSAASVAPYSLELDRDRLALRLRRR